MVSAKYGARLSEKDVADLAAVVAAIHELAFTIQRANPVWAAAAVQVLTTIQDVVIRLQNKGAEAFARYLEKRGLKPAQDEPAAAAESDQVAGERSTPQNEEEG